MSSRHKGQRHRNNQAWRRLRTVLQHIRYERHMGLPLYMGCDRQLASHTIQSLDCMKGGGKDQRQRYSQQADRARTGHLDRSPSHCRDHRQSTAPHYRNVDTPRFACRHRRCRCYHPHSPVQMEGSAQRHSRSSLSCRRLLLSSTGAYRSRVGALK